METSMRVFLAGASGMLGHSLVPALRAAGMDVVAHGNSKGMDVSGDLTDAAVAADLVAAAAPDVVVNLAALTNVDRCEEVPDEAYHVNVKLVENLVAALEGRSGAHFVQISTDQVYEGSGPFSEDDVHITNTYAFSKYAGELAASKMPATILRTNFFGRSQLAGRPSFSDWLEKTLRAGTVFTGFTDVLFSPLGLDSLVAMITRAVEARRSGVFNLGSHGGLSKADFAIALADHLGLDAGCMARGSVADMSLMAYRPRDMRMNVSRFEQAFSVALPDLKDEIATL
ncbi:SDR family oxidoreductase [Hoeflea sp. AS16]|uniref:SDR family oxidoreductase n=1 Tax=Hoeflea sp. AS16 TaxID=3135779 RepID=UPI0031717021